MRSAWAFTFQCRGRIVGEESGAFAVTQNVSKVCILSDSMCMLRKVQTGCVRGQWLESVQRSMLQKVTFIFVPGHVGVRGNEGADRLAGTAIIFGGRAMDRVDILNAVTEKGRTLESGSHLYSDSLF